MIILRKDLMKSFHSVIKRLFSKRDTAKKVPVFGVFLVRISRIRTEYGEILRIHSKCGKVPTRKTSNTDTFHAVRLPSIASNLKLTRSHNDVEIETITDVEIDIYLGMRTHVFRNLSNF